MVVLPNPGLFAADIQATKHPTEECSVISRLRQMRFAQGWGTPRGRELQLGQAAVQEIHIESRHALAVIEDMESAAGGETSQNSGFHISPGSQCQEFVNMLRRHSQGHALLGLR